MITKLVIEQHPKKEPDHIQNFTGTKRKPKNFLFSPKRKSPNVYLPTRSELTFLVKASFEVLGMFTNAVEFCPLVWTGIDGGSGGVKYG